MFCSIPFVKQLCCAASVSSPLRASVYSQTSSCLSFHSHSWFSNVHEKHLSVCWWWYLCKLCRLDRTYRQFANVFILWAHNNNRECSITTEYKDSDWRCEAVCSLSCNCSWFVIVCFAPSCQEHLRVCASFTLFLFDLFLAQYIHLPSSPPPPPPPPSLSPPSVISPHFMSSSAPPLTLLSFILSSVSASFLSPPFLPPLPPALFINVLPTGCLGDTLHKPSPRQHIVICGFGAVLLRGGGMQMDAASFAC